MPNIIDERGYNQIFKPTTATAIRLRRRAEAIVQAMALPGTAAEQAELHTLELGSGMGDLSHELALLTGGKVTGVDLSPKFIAHAKSKFQHPKLNFIVANLAESSPVNDEDRYDYIVGNGILHHLYHHLDTFLPVLDRWLKPNGRLIFWEPNLWNPYVYLIFSVPFLRRAANLEPDEMAFTPNFIRQKLAAAGFHETRVVTRDFLLPNTPDILIQPVIKIGNWLDRIPVVNRLAQSVFFVSGRSSHQ